MNAKESGICCPICGNDTYVWTSRRGRSEIRRTRRCENAECEYRTHTRERVIGEIIPPKSISVTSFLKNFSEGADSSIRPTTNRENGKQTNGL